MKHKHHIIPKYMGGQDDSSNIVELSINEHAEAHRILFEQYGNWQDYLAWKGLSGQITKEDILLEIYKENGRNRRGKPLSVPAWNKGLTKNDPRVKKYADKIAGVPKTEEHKKKLKKQKRNSEKMGKYERTDEVKEKLRNSAKTQFSQDARLNHSIIMKSKRSTCKYCGLESNTSNVKRHEKKCSSLTSFSCENPPIP